MGKKGKRTRWRTLTLNGHESDSESSDTAPTFKFSKSYQPKYSKYPYSSQSTPTRKFQYEGKSTRSSSTTSEQKITFNEDEYTRITTPRQDVLFKKGYLSKPKNYHTQTSTGTTCSTANSTSTCTPDHHSADGAEGTDLEYESQFVFPNVFVDQNGIYYLNSLEPFPFVVYNAAPAYYPPECPSSKTKRYSTDSAVESASPNNEEVLTNGGGLDATTLPGVPVFQQEFLQSSTSVNYYSNGTSQNDVHTDQRSSSSNDVRRLKKKRRKRLSTLQQQSQEGPASSEHTDNGESDEVLSQSETGSNVDETSCVSPLKINTSEKQSESIAQDRSVSKTDSTGESLNTHGSEPEQIESCDTKDDKESIEERISGEELTTNECGVTKEEESHIDNNSHTRHSDVAVEHKEREDVIVEVESKTDNVNFNAATEGSVEEAQKNSYQLKPDAEEFVPRALRHPQHLPLNPALQFVNLPPTYMPIPIINPIGSVSATAQQPFTPVFLPSPGMPPPLNIVTQPQLPPLAPPPPPQSSSSSHDTKAICTYQPSIQNVATKQETLEKELVESTITNTKNESLVNGVKEELDDKVKESQIRNGDVDQQTTKVPQQGNRIDIAQIVFKLEEAAKEQNQEKPQQNVQRRQNKFNNRPPQQTFYGDNRQKVFGNSPRRNNFYNRRNEQSYKTYENNTKQQKIAENQPVKKSEFKNQKLPTSENTLRTDVNSIDNVPPVRPKNSPNRSFSTSSHPTPNLVSIVENKIHSDQKVHRSPVNCSRTVQQQSAQSPSRSGSRFDKQGRKSDKPPVVQRNHSSPRNSIQLNEITVENGPRKLPNSQNQWISVSNRKKRRNKNQEDSENETNQELIKTDSIESFIMAQVTNENVTSSDNSLDNILPNELEAIKSSETLENVQNILENTALPQAQVVSEIHLKEDTIIHENADIKQEETVLIVESQEVLTAKVIVNEEDNNEMLEEKGTSSEKTGTNKYEKKMQNKSTKKNQKVQSRKIMITDPDTSFTLQPNSADVIEETECKSLKMDAPEVLHKGEENLLEEVVQNSSQVDLLTHTTVKEEQIKDNIHENVEETLTSHKEAATDETASKTYENSDKKSKRKKKRTSLKTNLNKNLSASSSSSILNVDDPYNYLLEDIILKDSDNKTNEEISEELDRIIQKGMYSSLEEKLKTIKVTDSTEDQFFKMFNVNSFTQKKPAQNNTTPIKITDFASILKNSIFGGKQAEQVQKNEVTFPQITFPNLEDLPQPSTSRSGFFLENPETTELIKNITNNTIDVEPPLFQICMVEHHPNVKSKSDNKLKCKNKKSKRSSPPLQSNPKITELTNGEESPTLTYSENSPTNGVFFRDSNESGHDTLIDEGDDKVTPLENGKETLYPITQAVKEWMTKTRETTPDIDILKSPDVILKEFIESDSELDETQTGSTLDKGIIAEKISNGYSNHNGTTEVVKITTEEEVTLFTANDDWSLSPQTSIEEEDLLECWDNEIPKNPSETDQVLNQKTNGRIKNGFAEDDDDIIEEYESRYGKNEDFLKLKAEIEEKKKHMNFPKHGNLPYRAICCNIM